MALNEVKIYNMAINAIGNRDDVAATTESSREAEVCRTWYEPVRDFVLRAAYWPSCKAFSRLALQAERDTNEVWVSTDPEPGYLYVYAGPSDMLAPRYLTTFANFSYGVYGTARSISTNQETPILCYTKRQTDISLWDPQLQLAVALALASFISGPLRAKPGVDNKTREQANQLILEARVNTANSEQQDYETLPEWITARGFGGAASSRFFWPTGPLISAGSIGLVS